jgi:hypothetical protein
MKLKRRRQKGIVGAVERAILRALTAFWFVRRLWRGWRLAR